MTTVVTDETESWTTPAGWGIYADLTPPELLNGRKLHRVRRLLLLALIGAVVLIVGGFGYGVWVNRTAAADLARQSAATTQITAQEGKYASVTGIQGTAAQFRGQLYTLMSTDVEFGTLLGSIRLAQPKTVGVTALQITVTSAGASAAGSAAATGSGSLATSGLASIGTVTISGTVDQLSSLQRYLAGLQAIRGVVDVLPGTLTSSGGAYTFSLSASIDAQALTGKYVAVVAAPVPTVAP